MVLLIIFRTFFISLEMLDEPLNNVEESFGLNEIQKNIKRHGVHDLVPLNNGSL